MAPSIELNALIGVWARRSIRWADGSEDTSTRVWWLQAQPHYADVRLPANRPSFAGVTSFDAATDVQRQWLATQQGFAGRLTQQDGAWLWRREVDYQPPTGKRDIGRLRFDDAAGRFMTEEGVDEPYVEVWERIDDGSSTRGEALVLRLDDPAARAKGLLVAVGDHFLIAMESQHIGKLELSHGKRHGPLSQWIVEDSTFPWREQTLLFNGKTPVVDWRRREVITDDRWSIVEPAHQSPDWVF